VGALGIIRLSGAQAIHIAAKAFAGRDLNQQASHTVHFGTIRDAGATIDEVLAAVFVAPRSFTKEHVVEFSCHGSPFILQQIVQILLRHGARLAKPGEFTQRAFLNGKFDLAQAEAVADLINADSQAAHMAAMHQMRGGFSKKIKDLRAELVHFASMIELELDFAEEDVEFASRQELRVLVERITHAIDVLISSFAVGNVIKNGVPTVIAGKPNAGKSTLLNVLLNEDKAIVSDIPGTTRDFIEDEVHIDGIRFRFVDTAGIREAQDTIEALGVQRTHEKMKSASLIIYLFDLQADTIAQIAHETAQLRAMKIPFIRVGNKLDCAQPEVLEYAQQQEDMILISARDDAHIDALKAGLVSAVQLPTFRTGDTVVTSLRHYDSLTNTRHALAEVLQGIEAGITNDFLALDIRQSLHHLGEITGEITTEDLLENIFSKFCIGK
jgi:tRNA modification GTPase